MINNAGVQSSVSIKRPGLLPFKIRKMLSNPKYTGITKKDAPLRYRPTPVAISSHKNKGAKLSDAAVLGL